MGLAGPAARTQDGSSDNRDESVAEIAWDVAVQFQVRHERPGGRAVSEHPEDFLGVPRDRRGRGTSHRVDQQRAEGDDS